MATFQNKQLRGKMVFRNGRTSKVNDIINDIEMPQTTLHSSLVNCVITNNKALGASGAAGLGGGVYTCSDLTVTNCDLEDNEAGKGGGLFVGSEYAYEFNFPIGSVIATTTDTNPAAAIGYGTWSQYAQGRALVGVDPNDADFNAAGKTGGAATVTLTEAQLPAHQHPYQGWQRVADGGGSLSAKARSRDINVYPSDPVDTTDDTNESSYVGGGAAHNNLPPYMTVYYWRRTA